MSTLADQQQALLEALFSRSGPDDAPANTLDSAPASGFRGARGLLAYRANGHAQAERSLLATYPVLAQLFGDESFAMLARDFWHAHPPALGDLAQWGGALPAFVAANVQLHDEPYLADVGRVEWALHRCATAADLSPDLASLGLLSTVDPGALRLRLANGTALVGSVFPVASIVTAHLHASPSFERTGQMLRDGLGETALVWRQALRPRITACHALEAAFLHRLLLGNDLLTALEHASEFDFALWLPNAVQNGLVLGAMTQ